MSLFRVLPVLTMLVGLVSCVHLEQEIRIEDERRGRFRIHGSIPIALYQSMVEPEHTAGTWVGRWFHSESGAQLFPESDGFRLEKYRVYERNGRKFVRIEGKLSNWKQALRSGRLGQFSLHSDSGVNTVRMVLDGLEKSEASGRRTMPSKTLRDLTHDLQLTLIIHVPNAILETNAAVRESHTATWIFDPAISDDFLTDPSNAYIEFN